MLKEAETRYLTTAEAAQLLGRTKEAIRQYQYRGKLKVAARIIKNAKWSHLNYKQSINLYDEQEVLSLKGTS